MKFWTFIMNNIQLPDLNDEPSIIFFSLILSVIVSVIIWVVWYILEILNMGKVNTRFIDDIIAFIYLIVMWFLFYIILKMMK